MAWLRFLFVLATATAATAAIAARAPVRESLIGLDSSDEGRKKLEGIAYEGFARHSEADILAIGKWLVL